ncbi:transposase [Candidatus Uhrbacteria bacterium]|nr:transposase [Candidatus Uhrbacteria bacterium]
MPRKPRGVIGDVGIFHVYNRGNNKKPVFHDDEDCLKFRQLILRAKRKTGIRIFYYAWMPNHYHLLVDSLNAGCLSLAMKMIEQGYSIWHRNKYGGIGHLWQDRFKSKLISDEIYFATCSSYIELNPVRSGLCERPEQYRWTSYRGHTSSPHDRIITFDDQYLSIGDDPLSRHRAHRELTEHRMEIGHLTSFSEESNLMKFDGV